MLDDVYLTTVSEAAAAADCEKMKQRIGIKKNYLSIRWMSCCNVLALALAIIIEFVCRPSSLSMIITIDKAEEGKKGKKIAVRAFDRKSPNWNLYSIWGNS